MIARFPVAATLLYVTSAWATPLTKRQNDTSMIYSFKELPATDDLVWKPCFNRFTCTKLKVPLDYEDEAAGTTHVSFIKWTNSTSNSTQDILYNPGGPGGSGIQAFMYDGSFEHLLGKLGSEHNLVTFDPRGVNNSGPDVTCMDGKQGTYRLYDEEFMLPLDVDDVKTYRRTFQFSAAWGEFCNNAHSGANDTAKYANTIATASDMLRYTELLAKSLGQDPKKSELWYYGVSYGTTLGTTFASLFPDRVGRMIVDGVVDGEDYYNGGWKANLPDADEAFETFYQSCYDAGSSKCKSWKDSPAAIKTRFLNAMESLAENPIPVASENRPSILTIDYFKTVLQRIPYSPIGFFPALDDMIIGIEERNTSRSAFLRGRGGFPDVCDDSSSSRQFYPDFEPRYFIACTDANNRTNLTSFSAWQDHANYLANQSTYLGESWASGTAILCRNLNIRAPPSQVMQDYPAANSTRNPLLFASTRLDPVTPLRAAQKMKARFGGAGLLVLDAVGHATESTPSNCTDAYFREYLKDASLPPVGTVCKPDLVPFDDTVEFDEPNALYRNLLRRGVPNIGH